MKTLGELSRDEKIALMTAWVDGKTIQWAQYPGSDWFDLDKGCPNMWYERACYRIATTPDTVRWEFLADWVQYVARDKKGATYGYEHTPYLDRDSGMWWRDGGGKSTRLDDSTKGIITPGTCNWKDSLVKRP